MCLWETFSSGRRAQQWCSQSRGGSDWHITRRRCTYRRYDAPHLRICDARLSAASIRRTDALSLGVPSTRETPALSTGLIPAVRRTLSLSLHLLPAGLRTFRCDRHALRNAEKPGSIRVPAALLRLVNILHAVGAGRVLRRGPRGARPRYHTARITYLRALRAANGAGRRRRKSGSIQHTARFVYKTAYPIIYSLVRGATQAKTLSRNGKFIPAVSFREVGIKDAMRLRNLFFQTMCWTASARII